MRFFEVLTQVIGLLVLEQRVSYRALKRAFELDDAYLEDLKVELITVKQLAVDQDGEMLVWTGGVPPPAVGAASQPTTPAAPSVTLPAAPGLAPPATLAETPPEVPPAIPEPTRSLPEAERRHLTVVFCDLVDSTRLAGQLDPEDYRAVVRAYQEAAAAVIQRFEGYLAQLLGDGLLVYFGYPQAHEDAAQRAVRASLALVEAIGNLNTRLTPQYGVRLAVRLGMHTGLVVIGEMGSGDRHEPLALGETPNIAARLQGLAAPDTVVLSATTVRLVQGVFALEALGAHHLKGVTEPMPVYRVLGLVAALPAEEDAAPTGVPFLVGRDEEVGLLRRRWEQSKDGVGQVVLLSGEAGIGKSTLVAALRAHVGREASLRMAFRCSPYHTNSALYPIIEHLQRWLHVSPDAPPETKLDRLEQGLRPYRLPLEEGVPLVAALLSVPVPERYPPLRLTPPQQKQQTLDVLVAWLLEEAERQPVLAVWEDLHWADPSTLELLGLVIDQAPTVPMLTVLTFRPVFVPTWSTRSHLTPLTLNRLERPQVEALLTHLAGGKALPAEVVQHIVTKTDGVPLFVEELTKMLLESGLLQEEVDHYALTGPLSALTIPATLQDSLMARLDRLPAAREVAQLGAVLGREFAYEVLRAVSPLDEASVQARLGQLVAAELLYQRGRPPRATYLFKHALIQDAAYASLLKSTRQQYHQRIAQVFAERFHETAETQPELLAHHYTEAGLSEQAVHYWQRAGELALQRSAYVEAIAHLTKGLEVLTTLPDTPERTQHELVLQTTLGPALMVARGQGAPEVGQAYARARELCQQVGETPQLFPALWGLWRFYWMRTEHQTAWELAEQCLSLAQRLQDPALLLGAHLALGGTLLLFGEFAPARASLEQGMALYDPQVHRSLAVQYGHDPGVIVLSYAAWALWFLGYPEQALQRMHEAFTLAQELSHQPSLAAVLTYAAQLHLFRREGHAAQDQAEADMALSSEQGLPQTLTLGTIYRGWALAEQGQRAEGIAQMRQGLAARRAIGTELWRPYFLVLLAEVYGKVGQGEEGLHVLAEALALVDKNGERFYEAETYRLKGELLLQQTVPDASQAETCLHQALAVARHQQAKSLELRAAMSLSRLWQQQGKRAEARELLAEAYGWFTEGFDTADLQEAKALLDELG